MGPDDIRVSRPGYLGDVPGDYLTNPDWRGSKHLFSFAIEQGWYDPNSGKPFNVNAVYGDRQLRHEAVVLIEDRLREKQGKITLADLISAVRTPEVTRDTAGYGQVAHLRKGVPDELGVLWVAAASSTTAPFIPWHLGVTEVPPEFQRHRYLTEGEAEAFQDLERQGLESTKYAFRVFKRLFYLTKEHAEKFQPEIMEAFTAFEAGLIADQLAVEKTALTLFKAGENDLARKYLTEYSSGKALDGLRLGEALAESLEARTKALYRIRRPRPTGR